MTRPMDKRPPVSRIPTFEMVGEEAAFWDSHSFADFEDELKIVTNVKFVRARRREARKVRGQDTT